MPIPNVSKTGRSEELRSAYAINRSYLVHNQQLSKMSAPKKAEWLIRSAEQFAEETTFDDNDDSFKRVLAQLRNEHFKKKREKDLISRVEQQGLVLRPENVRQRTNGVDRTNTILHQITYGAIKKGNP